MDTPTRTRASTWLLASLTTAVLLALGSREVFWSGDFMAEAWVAYDGLRSEGWSGFAAHLPGYSGFVVLVGAPMTLVADTFGGQETALLRLTAIPGCVILATLAARLGGHARREGLPGWPLVVVLGAGGPVGFLAIEAGHPEDLVAAGTAVLAVLAASRQRPTAAALLLLAGVLAKQWAVFAVLPAVLALEHGRPRVLLVAGGGAAAVVLLQLLVQEGQAGTIVNTGALFHPQQVWWPLGVATPAELMANYGRGPVSGPDWLQPLTRPILAGAIASVCAAWWLRSGRRTATADEALALLALVFALRCVLDPWNNAYYQLPLVLALLAWEVRRGEPYPIRALAVHVLCWLSFVSYDARGGMAPFLLYFAWMAPLIAHLGLQAFGVQRLPWRAGCLGARTSGGRPSSPSTSTT